MLVESVTGYVLQMTVYQGKRFDPTPAKTYNGNGNFTNEAHVVKYDKESFELRYR
jgi:hypothetical protein